MQPTIYLDSKTGYLSRSYLALSSKCFYFIICRHKSIRFYNLKINTFESVGTFMQVSVLKWRFRTINLNVINLTGSWSR
jgi:hypothetical protein